MAYTGLNNLQKTTITANHPIQKAQEKRVFYSVSIENQAIQFYASIFNDAESSSKKYVEENFSVQKLMKIQTTTWNTFAISTWNASVGQRMMARPKNDGQMVRKQMKARPSQKCCISPKKIYFWTYLIKIKIRPRYTWRDQDQVQHASLHALSTNACRLLVENNVNSVFSFSKIKLIKII